MRLLKRTARSWYSGFMAFILVGLLIVPAGAVYALSPRERSENAPGEATDEVGGGLREAIGQNSVREDLRFVSGDYDLSTQSSLYSAVGSAPSQYFGFSVATGDINGDGKDDLVVGENKYSGGRVYVFYSTSFNYLHTQRTSDEADVIFNYRGSSYSSYFGFSVAVGDANGDGYDDVLIGAYGVDSYRGEAYLFFGNSSLNRTIGSDEANVTYSGRREQSPPPGASYSYSSSSTYFGRKVALKDLNGDGLADAIISQPYWSYYYYYYYSYPSEYHYYWTYYGKVFVFYGRTDYNDTYLDADDGDADIEITGWAPARIYSYRYSWGSYYYYNVYAYLGDGDLDVMDINGDSYNDLVIGSPRYYDYQNYIYSQGQVAVLLGSSSGFPSQINLRNYPSSKWINITGSSRYYYLGDNVASGDINGDGYDDLVAGAHGASSYRGQVYVYYGGPYLSSGGEYTTSDANVTITGASGSNYLGSVAVGDHNRDGYDDLLMGAGRASSSRGEVYLILGTPTLPATISLASYPYQAKIKGPASSSYLGYYYGKPLAFMDIDSDGYKDLVMGAYRAPGAFGARYAGGVYIFPAIEPEIRNQYFRLLDGDKPNNKTCYAEYKNYTFEFMVTDTWHIEQIEGARITLDYTSGTIVLKWDKDGKTVFVESDPLGVVFIDPASVIITNDTIRNWTVHFTLRFALTFPTEVPIKATLHSYGGPLEDIDTYEDMFRVITTFRFLGNFTVLAEGKPLESWSWVKEGTNLLFTGVKLVYNGTEDFYPSNDLFDVILQNNLGEVRYDNSSSGRDISLTTNVGREALTIMYEVKVTGLPYGALLNPLPPFYVKVDNDDPGIPQGFLLHADSYDDPNILMDNDREVYLTWRDSPEFNSGIDHYVISYTNATGEAKLVEVYGEKRYVIEDAAEGLFEVYLWAVDNVGHEGAITSSSIFIDLLGLRFEGFRPSSEIWHTTRDVECSIEVKDIGGSQIDGPSIQYAISTDGPDNFGPWMSAGINQYGSSLKVVVLAHFDDGEDNYIKFRAMDRAGNGPFESEAFQIRVDTQGVVFSDFSPATEEWLASSTQEISIVVSDGLSGVDPTSIQYRYTTRGRQFYSGWADAGITSGGNSITVTLNLNLAEGRENYIQFRAKDIAGNYYTYSEEYNIWINTAPRIQIALPQDGLEVLENKVIKFDASGTEDEDGDELQYTWTSNISNVLSHSPIFQMTLPPGVHLITLEVTDGIHTVSDSVTVKVKAIPRHPFTPDSDHDGDGMPDIWEYSYHLDWRTPSADNDADGDQYTDYEEYTAHTNPIDPTDYPKKEITSTKEKISYWLYLAMVVILILLGILISTAMAYRSRKHAREVIQKELEEERQLELEAMERALKGVSAARLEMLSSGVGVALPTLPAAPVVAEPEQALPPGEEAPPAPAEPQPTSEEGAPEASVPESPPEQEPLEGGQETPPEEAPPSQEYVPPGGEAQ